MSFLLQLADDIPFMLTEHGWPLLAQTVLHVHVETFEVLIIAIHDFLCLHFGFDGCAQEK